MDIVQLRDWRILFRRKTLPKTTIPRASNFNQLVSLDLKYNKKYSEKSPPYILYIIDAFTRYKAAVFLNDKSSTTVIEGVKMISVQDSWTCSGNTKL